MIYACLVLIGATALPTSLGGAMCCRNPSDGTVIPATTIGCPVGWEAIVCPTPTPAPTPTMPPIDLLPGCEPTYNLPVLSAMPAQMDTNEFHVWAYCGKDCEIRCDNTTVARGEIGKWLEWGWGQRKPPFCTVDVYGAYRAGWIQYLSTSIAVGGTTIVR